MVSVPMYKKVSYTVCRLEKHETHAGSVPHTPFLALNCANVLAYIGKVTPHTATDVVNGVHSFHDGRLRAKAQGGKNSGGA